MTSPQQIRHQAEVRLTRWTAPYFTPMLARIEASKLNALIGKWLNKTRTNTRKKGRRFTITAEWVTRQPSLNRIDTAGGYTRSDTRAVRLMANLATNLGAPKCLPSRTAHERPEHFGVF
jgi:hypothetical protein